MSTFYQYEYPTELIADLQDQKKIFFEKGLIANITVASKPTNEDGFIMIYAYNYNAVFQNVNRYSYTLTQFRQLTFSQESLGLYYYHTIDPQNHIYSNWIGATPTLTAGQKSEYMTAAYNMLKKNFVAKWDLSWNLQVTPAPIIKIETLDGINVANNSNFIASDSVINETNQLTFVIKNIGTSRLSVSNNGFSFIDPPAPGDNVTFAPIDDELNPNVDSLQFTISYTFADVNPSRTFNIFIETNDPLIPLFMFSIETNVTAVPAPAINLAETYTSPEYIVFDRFDTNPSSLLTQDKVVNKIFKNEGNANLEITGVNLPEIQVPDGDLFVVATANIIDPIILPGETGIVTFTFTIPTNPDFDLQLNNYLMNNPTERFLKETMDVIVETNAGDFNLEFTLFYY